MKQGLNPNRKKAKARAASKSVGWSPHDEAAVPTDYFDVLDITMMGAG